jgi:hypothetical protein
MKKLLCALTVLAFVATAGAEVELRFWLTDVSPSAAAGGPITFETGYGPLTPFAAASNDSGNYDIQRNYVSTTNPGSVRIPKFTPDGIPNVVEPAALADGTPVYLWAAFAGPGDVDPIKPGIGWEVPDVRVQGLALSIQTTGSLVLTPHWYQYEIYGGSPLALTGTRWADSSDMSGGIAPDIVTLVGLGTGTPASTGWNAGTVTERLQTWALDSAWGGGEGYGAGAILLAAFEATGLGSAFVGVDRNGISTTDETGAIFYSGSETVGIPAGKLDPGAPLRVGQTPEATWVPEPASLLLVALGALALRRR